MYYFEIEHSEFYMSNFGDFLAVNFPIRCQIYNLGGMAFKSTRPSNLGFSLFLGGGVRQK